MVCDDDVGAARAANAALDETNAVMRTGGIDAFAAAIGQFAQRQLRGKKSGKSSAGKIAIRRSGKPARNQCQCYRARRNREATALDGIFEIEQAEIIFPALAQYDLQFPLARGAPEF